MATYAPSFTPRLRMTRHSPVHYDRSQIASTSESGPSRLPDFSQLVDVNLNDMAASDTTDQPTQSRISTSSTITRSDNPAAVLRALLSRLPTQPSSPPRTHSPQQYPSERESDYDDSEPMSATPSRAQESLKDIFSKARRDPDTPRKSLPRRNSVDASEVEAHSVARTDRTVNKGKQRSLSDDELDQSSQTPNRNRTGTRSKLSPQPVTMEFLRERFSNSYVSLNGVPNAESSHPIYDPSNESLLQELNSSGTMPPVATSTPQQSLRMSVNSQFHSNLLESDTEMQHAIDGLDSYGDNSVDRSISPPPTIRKGPKPKTNNRSSSPYKTSHDLDRTPSQSNTRSDVTSVKPETDALPEVAYKRDHSWNKSRTKQEWHNTDNYLDSHIHQTGSLSSMDLTSPLGGAAVITQRSRTSFSVGHDPCEDVSRDEKRERANSRLLNFPLSDENCIEKQSKLRTSYRSNSSIQQNNRSTQQLASFSRPTSPSGSSAASYDEAAVEQRRDPDKNWDSSHPRHYSNSDHQLNSMSPSTPRDRSINNNHQSHRKNSESPVITQDLKEPPHSHSPLTHREPSPTPSRTSSLQTIDNTYLHRDPSLRRPSRSSSPLHSVSKKRPASPTTSTVSRKLKTSTSTPLGRKQSASQSSLNNAMETPSRFISSPPRDNSVQDSIPKFSSTPRNEKSAYSISSQVQMGSTRRNEYEDGVETDELRDTDFSSRGGTPVSRPISPVHSDHAEDSEYASHSSLILSRFPVPPSTPRNITQSRTPPRRTSPERSTTPSTPPQRPTSRNSRRDFKTPSPPQTLPELPTPSSSDESEEIPTRNQTTTPILDPYARQDSTWAQTPKPPGGWSQTPKPNRKPVSDSEQSDDGTPITGVSKKVDDHGARYPRTPLNRNDRPSGSVLDTIGKTPKPPGGWLATPAPVSSTISLNAQISTEETSKQNAGLLTPMTSLSKGTTFDSKTPGVPGGWLATPAARKSILKVRFDSWSQQNQPLGQHINTTAEFGDNTPSQPAVMLSSRSEGVTLPPSPRSPRKGKAPNIRVVDAFGRQQGVTEVEDDKTNRSMLRVVDALGREVQQSESSPGDDTTVEQDIKFSSRGELLKHIRRGLDDLAEEFDDEAMDDTNAPADQARIEELNKMSQKARMARERLHDDSTKSMSRVNLALEQKFAELSSWRNRRRFWLTILLAQLILLIFMFRISSHWAKQRYLNSYYDPFNPELYLYVSKSDHSYLMDDELSRASWSSYARRHLLPDGRTWHDWLRFSRDIQSYLWNFLNKEPPPRNGSTWLPT